MPTSAGATKFASRERWAFAMPPNIVGAWASLLTEFKVFALISGQFAASLKTDGTAHRTDLAPRIVVRMLGSIPTR